MDIASAQHRMAKLMRAEGLPYGERTMTYNSRLAQELAKWAVTQPRGEAIHDSLFRAYFVDGLNIGRIDDLVRAAEPMKNRQLASHWRGMTAEKNKISALGISGRDQS